MIRDIANEYADAFRTVAHGASTIVFMTFIIVPMAIMAAIAPERKSGK